MAKHKFETRAVGEGHEPDFREGANGDVVVPIHLTSTYARKKVDELQNGYEYCRCQNPTRKAFETCLASLEGAKHCISTSSGLAAIMNVTHLLERGDHIVAFEDIYGGTIRIFNQILPSFGIETSYVDATKIENVKKAKIGVLYIKDVDRRIVELIDTQLEKIKEQLSWKAEEVEIMHIELAVQTYYPIHHLAELK